MRERRMRQNLEKAKPAEEEVDSDIQMVPNPPNPPQTVPPVATTQATTTKAPVSQPQESATPTGAPDFIPLEETPLPVAPQPAPALPNFTKNPPVAPQPHQLSQATLDLVEAQKRYLVGKGTGIPLDPRDPRFQKVDIKVKIILEECCRWHSKVYQAHKREEPKENIMAYLEAACPQFIALKRVMNPEDWETMLSAWNPLEARRKLREQMSPPTTQPAATGPVASGSRAPPNSNYRGRGAAHPYSNNNNRQGKWKKLWRLASFLEEAHNGVEE